MKILRRQHDDPRLASRRHFGAGCSWKMRLLLRTVVCCILIAGPYPVFAQGDNPDEYRLKLAFLCNFARFVEWPADTFRDPAAPLTICVAGNNPFQGEIKQSLQGRTVEGHPLEVRKLTASEDPHTCQIIFVRATEMKATPRFSPAPRARAP